MQDFVVYDELVKLRLEDGIDPTRKQDYLNEEEFQKVGLHVAATLLFTSREATQRHFVCAASASDKHPAGNARVCLCAGLWHDARGLQRHA